MMNLQEFVTETIKQIIDGVADTLEHARSKNAFINVPIVEYSGAEYKINPDSLPVAQMIEFDIAVTATDTKDIKGGMGIFVASFGIGYQGEKSSSGSEISRIKFSIPVILPSQIKPKTLYEGNYNPFH